MIRLYITEDYENNIENINDELSLIPATEEDLDLVIESEFYTIAMEFTKTAKYADKILPLKVRQDLIQDSKDSLEHTRIILYNEEPIGVLQAYELEGYWYIGEIYLKEEYRGQGIGRKVLEYEINNHRDKTICLNVYKYNTHAIELYKSLGFEVTEDKGDRHIIMKLFSDKNENL